MKNVLTYGTFDLFHHGHARLLTRAGALGGKLFVGVSTDKFNAVKGKTSWNDFSTRIDDVQQYASNACAFAEESFEQKPSDILRFKIDVFVMGDDWAGKFDWLKDYCEVVYLQRTPGISTTLLKSLAVSGPRLFPNHAG
jgi:glycerol-3-phosphate cytidylyltransferase